MFRLFFESERFSCGVELYHPVTFRIMYGIGEDSCATCFFGGMANILGKIMAVKNIVTKHQRAATRSNKSLSHQKCLCDPPWLALYRIIEIQPETRAVSQQLFESRSVLRSRNHQDVPNSSQHKGRKGVIDQRLVIDRQQALAHSVGGWIQSGSRPSRKDNSFIRLDLMFFVFCHS